MLKKEFSQTILSEFSVRALQRLEQQPAFLSARSFAIYHAMADEVQTALFIEKWVLKKKIYLPVICGDEIELHVYKGEKTLKPGVFGILEPVPEPVRRKVRPDLIIIPGIAFDRNMNRMGRGKGYYDRLLSEPELNDTIKMGLCFSFQIVPEVPTDSEDIRMHCVITDKELITPI